MIRVAGRFILIVAVVSLLPLGIRAEQKPAPKKDSKETKGPFDKVTVSFSFADDNTLRDPGETRINSPDAYFGQSTSSALDRFGGSAYHQSMARILLNKKLEKKGIFQPEGTLRLVAVRDDNGKYDLFDDGTFLQLNWDVGARTKVKALLLPIDSDHFRLGYHYDITWAGSNTFPKNFRRGLVPGAKLGIGGEFGEKQTWEAFVGMKTALIRSPAQDILDNPGGNTNQYVERAYYAAVGGGHVEPVKGLTLGVSGGYFQKGTSTKSEILGKAIDSWGYGGYVAYKTGATVGSRLDMRLYLEDPERFPLQSAAAQPDKKEDVAFDFDSDDSDSGQQFSGESSGLGFQIALEYIRLGQVLNDFDNYGSTKTEESNALAFSAGLRADRFRAFFDLIYRDLTYITFNVPGFVPYEAVSENVDLSHGGSLDFLPDFLTGELFGVVSFDYFIEALGLTPAVSFGLQMPATYMPKDSGLKINGPFPPEHLSGVRKVVVRGVNDDDWDILPAGEDEMPVFVTKLLLKYTYNKQFSAFCELLYAVDNNYAQVLIDDHGHAKPVFDKPEVLGFGLVAELTF